MFGTSNQQLRQYFTAGRVLTRDGMQAEQSPEQPEASLTPEIRDMKRAADKFINWLRPVIRDGRLQAFMHYKYYAAADLARDGPPITQENIPLRAYAQGKIDVTSCSKELEKISPETRDKFIETKQVPVTPGEAGGPTRTETTCHLGHLQDVCISVCRAYTDRRLFAQTNKYNSAVPQFKYDPRDTSVVGRLRGEAMSALADIMGQNYGYRHQRTQGMRGALYYGHSIMFAACAWDRETRPVEADDGEEIKRTLDDGSEVTMRLKTGITREGVPMVVVHPSRVMYDVSEPLASLNTDTGCRWVGFWDVKRFGDIKGNVAYFNTQNIAYSSTASSIYMQNRGFFTLMFQDQEINFPNANSSIGPKGPGLSAGTMYDEKTGVASNMVDVAANNERKANQGLYTVTQTEMSVFVTDIRVRVVPRDHGMGDYASPVWLRLLVASDDTVIYAEWLPSRPAIYWGHNEDDAKLINLSQCHEIMWAQDALTNIMSNLLATMKRMLVQFHIVNKDLLGEEQFTAFCDGMKGDRFYDKPHVVGVSHFKLKELGLDSWKDAVLAIISPVPADEEYLTNAFKAVTLILSLLERLMALSPQELGQPANHEITAEEVNAIERTSDGIYSAISASFDEGQAAWEVLIYEASLAYASETVELAVTQEFTDETIEQAGFQVKPGTRDGGALQKPGRTIIGSKRKLIHNYTFGARAQSTQQSDAQSAQLLIQTANSVLGLLGSPGAAALGKKRIFEMCNEILRRIGESGFKFQIKDGEPDDSVGPEADGQQQAMQDEQKQMAAKVDQMGTALQQIAASNQHLQQLVQVIMAHVKNAAGIAPGEVAPGVPGEPGSAPAPDPFAAEQSSPAGQPPP